MGNKRCEPGRMLDHALIILSFVRQHLESVPQNTYLQSNANSIDLPAILNISTGETVCIM